MDDSRGYVPVPNQALTDELLAALRDTRALLRFQNSVIVNRAGMRDRRYGDGYVLKFDFTRQEEQQR